MKNELFGRLFGFTCQMAKNGNLVNEATETIRVISENIVQNIIKGICNILGTCQEYQTQKDRLWGLMQQISKGLKTLLSSNNKSVFVI